VAVNDILKLRVHCRMHGAEVINVMHFVDDFGLDVDNAQILANDFRDNMGTTLRARACSDLVFEYIEVVKIVPYGQGPRLALWPSNTLGTSTGSQGTATVAEVITIHTDQIGRRKRGRIYLAGGSNVSLIAGSWIAAQTTRTQAFATAMATRYMSAGTAGSYKLGVWSKLTAGPEPPWPTSAFTRATSLTVRTIARNQRRRQIGVGR
jgi:hypothetical protein